MKEIHKSIEYAYPTSPNADRLGFKRGCWTVQIGNYAEIMRPVAGFTTRDEAQVYADKLVLPWSPIYLAVRRREAA